MFCCLHTGQPRATSAPPNYFSVQKHAIFSTRVKITYIQTQKTITTSLLEWLRPESRNIGLIGTCAGHGICAYNARPNGTHPIRPNGEPQPHLRDEISDFQRTGWEDTSCLKLEKLDSVMQESQRLNPPGRIGDASLLRNIHSTMTSIFLRELMFVFLH